MNQIYLKTKRAIRYLFYRHLTIDEQLHISYVLANEELVKQYWLLNKADRHHSFEVLMRSIKLTTDSDVLKLSLLHDIGKNKAHYSWLFRILSELKINSSQKAKEYLRHELIGYEVLKKIDGIDNDISFYQKELIKQRHYVLEKMDY